MKVSDAALRSAREAYREQFLQGAASLPGDDLPWLRRVRGRAFERYAVEGLPDTRDEDWKYTSVAALEKHAFTLAPTAVEAVDAGFIAPHVLPDCALMVFVNGRHVPALSKLAAVLLEPRRPVVVIDSLATALAARPQAFETPLGAETPAKGFASLNAALWTDGAVVELAPGAVLERPLQLLFVATRPELALFTRNLIRLGAGAQAAIVEQHIGVDDGAYFTDTLTDIVLEADAALTHVKLQQEGRRACHVADLRVAQARNSRFASHAFAFGAQLARCDIATRFDGEGCEAVLSGLYLADGRRHVDHHTRIDHARPRGTSRQLYKGVIDDAARAVFNGKVIVHPDAQKSDAQQANRNLLLSPLAEIDTKPQLEIWADDVKCSHGATVGQLDAGQLFYLRSRGIGDAAARALLTLAFAGEMVTRVPMPALRERLGHLLRQRLSNGFGELPWDIPTSNPSR